MRNKIVETRTTKFGATVIKLWFYKDLSVGQERNWAHKLYLCFIIKLPDDKQYYYEFIASGIN